MVGLKIPFGTRFNGLPEELQNEVVRRLPAVCMARIDPLPLDPEASTAERRTVRAERWRQRAHDYGFVDDAGQDRFVLSEAGTPWATRFGNTFLQAGPFLSALAPPALRDPHLVARGRTDRETRALIEPSLLADEKFVESLLERSPAKLGWAAAALRQTRPDLVERALTENPDAFQHLEIYDAQGQRLRPARALELAPDQHQDLASVWAGLAERPLLLRKVGAELQRYRPLVRFVVGRNGLAIQFAHPDLRGDRELGEIAVRQNGEAIRWLSAPLKRDRSLAQIALGSAPRVLEWLPHFAGDDALVERAARIDRRALDFAAPETRARVSVLLARAEAERAAAFQP